jgi:TolB protein
MRNKEQKHMLMNFMSSGRRKLICLISILCSTFMFTHSAHAKIYIDIASPGIRQLPISILTRGPVKAKEMEWIIKNDLETTGMFSFVDHDVPGAEIKVSLDAEISVGMKIILSINDLIEGKEVRKMRLSSQKTNIRNMAHTISNHIYNVATEKKGVFKTRISYLATTKSDRRELRVMDWDGYSSIRINSKGLTSSHNWSNNGKFLLYSSERARKWKIFIRDRGKPRETVLFSSKGLNLVGGSSRDGLVAFSSSKDGSSEIYTINMYGKRLKKLTRSFGIDVSPVFSPDGDKIAFVSDRGGTPQIYIMSKNGRGLRRLSFEGSYNQSPVWSPDGKWIAYVGRKNGKNQIFMLKSDGNDLRQLTITGNNESPSFSPDGFFIAFDSDRDGKRGIYIMRASGEGQKRITPKYQNASTPRWSPYFK